jgi:MoxR-like ATPase
MPVSDKVVDAILLARPLRPPGHGNATTDKHVAWGPGPRAGQALMLTARARALYEGRLAPSLDDVLCAGRTRPPAPHGADLCARAEGMSVRDVIAGLVRQAGG